MTSNRPVHIRISDSGWILERLAKELSDRLPYVSYDLYENGGAEIQYYMTYGCRMQKVSPIEMALFTHKEELPEAAARFEKVSREVDFCIAQSPATERILRLDGVTQVRTISPGTDLQRFQPKVRVGVVGRTYHTGRKGEALVSRVMDIPGIEWHFTGSGWPGPAQFVADVDMPAFYRSLDYVLVPALIEGGPMCVLEALACGVPVIAPPVGWVPEFPHIEFKLGDATDLRRVLTELVEQRMALRRSVEAHTWDAWAAQHHEIFCRLLQRDPMALWSPDAIATAGGEGAGVARFKAIVAVHGTEMTTSLGGPSVRAPRTAASLRRIGVDAQFVSNRNFDARLADAIHVLNVWQPRECELLLQQAALADRAAVLSPIFLDLSERWAYDGEVLDILTSSATPAQVQTGLARIRNELRAQHSAPLPPREPIPGYFAAVRRLTKLADHLILLSEHERDLLNRIGVSTDSTSIVKNPVNAALFAQGDPGLFRAQYGISDFVLCVGRIEPRKNQALLAMALRDTDLPLVFIGHEAIPDYAKLVRKWAGPRLVFAGRVEPGSAMLASALAAARVFCLPSWCEGAPLAALEAAAAGCNMVLSNRSAEAAYFGDLARYADPANPDDLREKILLAYEEGRTTERAQRLELLVDSEHSWERYARGTLSAYEAAVEARGRKARQCAARDGALPSRVLVDLTTLAHHIGTPTGMARVEDRLASSFCDLSDDRVDFIYWDAATERFLAIDRDLVRTQAVRGASGSGRLQASGRGGDLTCFGEINVTADDHLVILGSAWMRNTKYIQDIAAFKRAVGLSLTVAIYDVIQWKFSSWYARTVADEFTENCLRFLPLADMVLTCSERTRSDLREFAATNGLAVPPIEVFRLGDATAQFDAADTLQEADLAPLHGRPFVLCVSTLDHRKNHRLLLELWRRLVVEHKDAAPALVLVGAIGWRGDETVDLLEAERSLQSHVRLMHGVNDVTLRWLYENCLFTVYPSLYEGWGLPVAESVRHGTFCISSDGGSLPEVAPGFVEYVNPLDFIGWYGALVKYIFDTGALAARKAKLRDYVPTEWRDVAREVIDRAALVHSRITRLEPLNASQPVSFQAELKDGAIPAGPFLLSGWSNAEPIGTWSIGSRAMVGFKADPQGADHLVLCVEGFGFAPKDEPTDVAMLVNGSALTRWQLGATPSTRYALLPKSLLLDSSDVFIEFRIANPRCPADFMVSDDQRPLGLRLMSLRYSACPSLALDSWHQLAHDEPTGDYVFHTRAGNRADCFLGVELWSQRPAAVSLWVGPQSTEFRLHTGPASTVHSLRLGGIRDGEDDAFLSVQLIAGQGNSVHISRAGLFAMPPGEALERAIRVHAARASQRARRIPKPGAHAPYDGAAPLAKVGVAMSIDLASGLVHGLAGGWHAVENSGVWSDGTPASLWLQFSDPPPVDMTIFLTVIVFEWLVKAGHTIQVLVGSAPDLVLSTQADDWSLGEVEIAVPVAAAAAVDERGRMAITLRSQGALAPSDLGLGPDPRPLGIKLRSLRIEPGNRYVPELQPAPGEAQAAGPAAAPSRRSGARRGNARRAQSRDKVP